MSRQFTRDDDIRVLEVIDSRLKGERQRDAMARLGVTKGAIAGIMSRFRETADIPCKCRKKSNRDGGMPDRWWAA